MNIYTKTSRIALIALTVILGHGLFASKAEAHGYTAVPIHGVNLPYGQVADNGTGFNYSNFTNAIVTGLGGNTTPYQNPLIYPQYNNAPVYTGNTGNQYPTNGYYPTQSQSTQYYYNNTNNSNNTNYNYNNTTPYQYNQNSNGQYNGYNQNNQYNQNQNSNQGTITLMPTNGNQNTNTNTNNGNQTITLIPTDGTNTNTNTGATNTGTNTNTGTDTGTGNYGNTW